MSQTYPRRCGSCGEKAVKPVTLERHACEIRHDGRLYSVVATDVPAFRCDHCASVLFGDAAEEAIDRALRNDLSLLQPDCIRSNIGKLDIRQNVIAEHLGAAPETVSRWINGSSIQSRMPDKFLRAYFALPVLREFLRDLAADPTLGHEVVPAKRAPQLLPQVEQPSSGPIDVPIPEAGNDNYRRSA